MFGFGFSWDYLQWREKHYYGILFDLLIHPVQVISLSMRTYKLCYDVKHSLCYILVASASEFVAKYKLLYYCDVLKIKESRTDLCLLKC